MRRTVKDLKLGDDLYYLNQTIPCKVTSLTLSGSVILVNGRTTTSLDSVQAGTGYFINEEDIMENRILVLENSMKIQANSIINYETAIKKCENIIKETGARIVVLKKKYNK